MTTRIGALVMAALRVGGDRLKNLYTELKYDF